ncbi:MAG: hypothetical protein MJ237_08795 [bacterium]|nr:hypothetical protein [bacterium]
MKISALNEDVNNNLKRSYISDKGYMTMPETTPNKDDDGDKVPQKPFKMGIENLQEFTIYPKQVVDGRTIITA